MKKHTEKSIFEHAQALRSGEYSAAELFSEYLREIKQKDESIGAFLTLDEEGAAAAAKRADEMLRGENASPLCGIPCAVKDSIMTQGVRTTCGSRILENYVPPYDATAVSLLKSCGAVILGKTNLDEFSIGSSTESSPFQKTVNPHDEKRSPGGSSGGSAAAVAAGEAAFALGSDTGGSIRQPSSFCGVVGAKPTYGSVSRYGLCAMTSSFDQIGPITRTVRDCAAVFSAICGKDKMDSTTENYKMQSLSDIFTDDLKGVRVALVKELTDGISPAVEAAFENAKRTLSELGCTFSEFSLPSLRYTVEIYNIICSAQVCSNMGRYDGIRFGEPSMDGESPADLRGRLLGRDVKKRMLFGAFVLSEENYEAYYKKAVAAEAQMKIELDEVFRTCDIILSPTCSDVAFLMGQAPKPDGLYRGDRYCIPANIAGLPSVSVPAGVGEGGLPIGILFTGARFSDALMYRIADAFERYRHDE